jgi:5-formyltetrahydrofolate cyclo-ligase
VPVSDSQATRSVVEQQKTALRAVWRARLRNQRAAAGPDAAKRVATALGRVFESAPPLADARRLGLFASLPDEIPTGGCREACLRLGVPVLWPRTAPDVGLEFVHCGFEELRPARYGVLEPPADRPATPLGEGDLVLVPGLAFDSGGGRLGRGGGHYDRVIAATRGAIFVGTGYSFQRIERVPREPHDRTVHALISEEEFDWARA